ncbi:hypothetical protein [Mycolicibacterium houstonense]|uniref:hypothetical protein n=1 Tax=Mycolicibacterium houstonense TaxID=146021 RepID=UPI003F9459B3
MQPFIGSAAIRRGELTRHRLARDYVALYRDVYVRRDLALTAQLRAQAAWLSTGSTLAGMSAAAILGTNWLDPGERGDDVASAIIIERVKAKLRAAGRPI